MKYVRTKDDTIYQVYDKVFEYKEDKRYQLVDSRFEISLNDIIKQADTIEELCDEFVVIRNNSKYVCDYIGEELCYLAIEHDGDSHYFSKKELLDLIVYGAIWTDKGLTYVAKMNNKGVLELL